ncbi:40S ribosomal protein S3 [Lemmus lemmus]
MIVWISKKIMSVVYDIIKDDLSELLSQELNDDGYNGIEVKVTLTRVEIIMLATRTQNVLGKGQWIRSTDCCSPGGV